MQGPFRADPTASVLRSWLVAGLCLVAAGAGCKTTSPESAVKADALPAGSGAGGIAAYSGPAGFLSEGENRSLWAEYCVGTDDPAVTPAPNYANPEVQAAAAKLALVVDHSFMLYKDIMNFYQTPPPAGVKPSAHNFLSYLCGEFRDRATLIRTKLAWVAGMNFLAHASPHEAFDPAQDVWAQMRIEDYQPYLDFSTHLWEARAAQTGTLPGAAVNLDGIDLPVPGLTVCETKLIFANYLRRGQRFTTLDDFDQQLAAFRPACAPDDAAWYYDFRGDSNFKPNTPEANGMIWFAQSVADSCQSKAQAKAGGRVTDRDCQRYFAAPFKSRWDAARAGLAAELLHVPALDAPIRDQSQQMTIVSRATADGSDRFGDKGPWGFRLGDHVTAGAHPTIAERGTPGTLLSGWQSHWGDADFGLATLIGDKSRLHELCETMVDRHTNWYQTGFDDGAPTLASAFARPAAWSPFVASSYEMSRSDRFVSPGFTVQAADATAARFKHWMFIFKVRAEHRYNTERLWTRNDLAIDFDHYWFDERSFGVDALAKDERAWDRLGEPLEDEYAAILYLHNMAATPTDQGESDSGQAAKPPHL